MQNDKSNDKDVAQLSLEDIVKERLRSYRKRLSILLDEARYLRFLKANCKEYLEYCEKKRE